MTDTTTVAAEATTPVAATAPAAPETWTQEAWADLQDAEQWVVSGLHQLGIIFTADVWPILKSTLGLLFSQLGTAIFGAISANIADPALIPAAVGAALILTASTTGVADAKNALASAEAAVQADPAVQSLIGAQAVPATVPVA